MADSFRKFEGFKRRKAPVKLGGIKAALFTLGLVIVGIYLLRMSVNKWTGVTEDSVTLDIFECYRPSKEADLANAKKLIEAMKKEQASACPKETLSTPMNIVAYGDSRVYHLTTGNLVSGGLEGKASDFKNPLSVNPMYMCGTHGTEAGIYKIADTYEHCYTLIAPFDFKFINANTDGSTIIITNKAGTLRVTFSDVAGWFCASAILDPESVRAHTSHGTVVGNSPNSYVQGGYGGNLIGFGDYDTKVQCHQLSDGTWNPITLARLLEAASTPSAEE